MLLAQSGTTQRPVMIRTSWIIKTLRRPWIYAIAATMGGWFGLSSGFAAFHHNDIKDLLNAAITVGAIAFTFMMTAQSVLIAIARNRVVNGLRDLRVSQRLIPIFGTCVGFYMAVVVFSGFFMIALTVPRMGLYLHGMVAIWCGLLAGAGAASLRLFNLYQEILRQELT